MKRVQSGIELKFWSLMKGLPKRGWSYGFTTVKLMANTFQISHGGNMGNSIETSVNPNLIKMGFPTVDELMGKLLVKEEFGSPDMMWHIKFDLTQTV